MRSRIFVSYALVLSLIAVGTGVELFLRPKEALAQQTPFLITPYYGSHPNPASRFDHDLPNYTPDNLFIRTDGQSWTGNVDKVNCITSVNCYDGHNGYDFGLYYERVLAAAAGTVTEVGWNNLSCGHWGPACLYGLHIKIKHLNNYVTLYGHLSSIAVYLGQYVNAGQIIGTSGDSGNTSGSDQNPTLGAHLHFTVTNDFGYDVDPFGWTGSGADPWNTHNGGLASSWFMWSGGEWAGTPIIVDPTPSVDPASCNAPVFCLDDSTNNSGGFSKGSGGPFNGICQNDCAGWTTQNFTGYQGNLDGRMYSTPANGNPPGDQWARWAPTIPIPSPGVYEVWVYIPKLGATSYQASYTINVPDGTYTAFGVDQYGLNNQWVSIGAYHFLNGTAGTVYVTDSTGENSSTRLVGADAVKFIQRPSYVSFQPDIKANSGWTPHVIVHNNSNSSANVYISILANDGSVVCGAFPENLAARETFTADASCGGSTLTTAVVDADQDVGIEVENEHFNGAGTLDVATNYTGISPAGQGGNPDWDQTGTTLYAPSVKYNRYGFTTDLYVLNAGSASTNATVNYYNSTGAWVGSLPCNGLNPNAQCVVTIPDTRFGNNLLLTAKLTSSAGQPLAAVDVERDQSGPPPTHVGSYNLLTSGATTLYVPIVKKQRYNDSTGVRVQNISAATATFYITYYDSNSSAFYTSYNYTVPANAGLTVYEDAVLPTNFVGSARITSLYGQLLTAQFNEVGIGTAPMMSATGTDSGSTLAIVPHIIEQCTGTCNGFVTGIRVHNIGGSQAYVTITYYNSGGTQMSQETINPLAGQGKNAAHVPVDSGSAVITSSQPIVVVANVANTYDTTKDLQMTYNVPNR